jgi:hypothetical protein
MMDKVKPNPIPEYFTLQITAVNITDNPVDFLIRHYYEFSWSIMNTITSYTDYTTTTVPANESMRIADEYRYHGMEDTMGVEETKGVYLFDSRVEDMRGFNTISSFEVKIITDNDTIDIAGYETTNNEFDDTGLGYFSIISGIPSISYHFDSKSQNVFCNKEYSLPVTITIHEDGTYSFEHDVIPTDFFSHIL